MPPPILLSHYAASAMAVSAMGLARPPRRRATKADVLEVIRRMGALQIDTISVVARSPYMVLYGRLGAFEQRWVEELLAEGKLFEYWSHEACFLPIEDYGLYVHRMADAEAMGWRYRREWVRKNAHEVKSVVAHLKKHGASRAADFEKREGATSGWWEWKPEKRALEALFTRGDVMVARRQSFQRVYDLRDRVHPTWKDDVPNPAEAQRQLVLKSVKALGITTARWVADWFRMSKTATPSIVRELAATGALREVSVEGWTDVAYVHHDNDALLDEAARNAIKPSHTVFLSPFDPLVWDRARALAMFGFDYHIECYTPAPKRIYGYYVLPLLRRGKLIGRMDAKAHRGEAWFEVKNLYLEHGVRVSDALTGDVARALRKLAAWHGTPDVRIARTSVEGRANAAWRKRLQQEVSQ